MDVKLHSFSTSAIGGNGLSASRPDRFTPRQELRLTVECSLGGYEIGSRSCREEKILWRLFLSVRSLDQMYVLDTWIVFCFRGDASLRANRQGN